MMEEVQPEGEEVKVEEAEKEEDVEDDEAGLFTTEFDEFMDSNGFQDDLGFSDDMNWIDNV